MSFLKSQRDLFKFILNYTIGKPVEATQAILQARTQNTMITEADTKFDDGKKRKLHFNYYPPICSAEGTGDENICNSGTVVEPKQDFFEISQITASPVYQVNPDDIRYVDGNYNFSQHAMAVIASAMPTVRENMNAQIAALLVANVGLLPNGNSSQLLPLINKQDGALNPMGYFEIERAYRDTGYSNPFVIGGTDVFHWKKVVPIGGVNNLGQDTSKMGAPNLFYDQTINTSFGSTATEHVLSFDPQMLKFVAFNRNAGMFATNEVTVDAMDAIYARGNDNRLKGVLPDPMTGLLWDLNIHYDDCANNGNGAWKIQWKLEWDIFFMPAKVCNKQGVNGLFHWTTCVQLVQQCETGSPITPASSATYSFDTNGEVTFPSIIQRVDIDNNGTITTYPNTSVANITELKNLLNDAANGVTFTVSGTELRYTGYSSITVTLNKDTDNEVVMEFTT